MKLPIFSRKTLKCAAAGVMLAASVGTHAVASDAKPKHEKSAIVLAAFGTTYESAVDSLVAIQQQVEQAYPNTPVRFAFTSNIIRKKWHSRQNDKAYQEQHPHIPKSFYTVKNVLGTMADLQNEGYRDIVVQTTLLTHGEEFIDLQAYVDGLASIKTIKEKWRPFNKVALGRPLMGTWGHQYEYGDDVDALAEALREDVELARNNNSALVYMGHGNEHLSTGLYYELAEKMNAHYPDVKTYVGVVEGHPDLDTILKQMLMDDVKAVTLKPLMVVAGDHATNDMAGDEDDAWKVVLTKAGIKVTPILEGLGSKATVRDRYLSHLKDAAKDAGITLK